MDTLHMKVALLEAELEDKQDDLQTAAEFGKKLLETNQELRTQLEENANEYTERIESLEQERFQLQRKVECQAATCEAVSQELELTRNQLEREHAMKLQHTEQTLTKKINRVTSLNHELKAENEKLEVQLKTLSDKVKIQQQTIEQLKQEASSPVHSTTLQNELQDLEQLYTQEKELKEDLQLQLVDTKGGLDVVCVENSALQQKVAGLEEECQERCRMANEWYEKLKDANDQNASLTSQLEALKLEMMDSNRHNSGNSLFGEVDDRRLNVERKMLSLQVKYDSLVKTHTTTNQHFKKMKAEMSALLCRCATNTAHAAQVQRLQRALDQSKSETQDYMIKLHKLEKQHVGVDSAQERRKCMSAFVDFEDKTEYVQLLEHELEKAKNDHTSVLKELDLKRTQLLWESNKLSETEAKLYNSEQEKAKQKREVTKLRIMMQETREKLDQANAAYKQLEVDKQFVEDQLKGKKVMPHSLRKEQSSSKPQSQPSSNDNSLLSESSKDQALKQQDRSHCSDSQFKAPRKEINILEELDVEFSKQKQKSASEKTLTTKKVGVPDKCLDKGPASGICDAENKGSHPYSRACMVPTVATQSKKVNECPQQ